MVKRTQETPPWYDLATETLGAAIDEDFERMHALLIRLGNEHHGDWSVILQTFCDAALYAQGVMPQDYGRGNRLTPMEVRSGELGGASMSEAQQWAAALIAARMADDKDGFYALLAQISTPQQATNYIYQLVCMVGLSVGRALAHGHVGPHEGGTCEH